MSPLQDSGDSHTREDKPSRGVGDGPRTLLELLAEIVVREAVHPEPPDRAVALVPEGE